MSPPPIGSSGELITSNAPPTSSETLIKAIFWLLGVGILLPWNAFISAKPYFDSRLCLEGGSSQGNVELWFGLIYNFSSSLSLGGLIWWQWRLDKRQSIESSVRLQNEESRSGDNSQSPFMVMLPLYIYLVVFLLTTGVVVVTDMSASFFLAFTLLSLSICGICTAFASAGIVATAGLFPSEIGTQPYFSGQALGGLAVAFANLAAAWLRDPQSFLNEHCDTGDRRRMEDLGQASSCTPYRAVDWSSFSYFLIGTIVLSMCIVGYSHVDSYKRAMLRAQYETLEDAPFEDEPSHSGLGEAKRRIISQGSIEMFQNEDQEFHVGDPVDTAANAPTEPASVESATVFVWDAIKGPAFAIFFTFAVTLALFPGWTSGLQSIHECQSHRRIHNDLYTPLTFVTFNAGDFTGRLLAARLIRDHPSRTLSRTLVLLSLCRCAFFPLFLLCLSRDSVFGGASIRSDLFSFVVQASFAILNGIVISASFSHAPTLIPSTQEMQTKASEIENFCLSFGLLCGSTLSFPFSKMASGHW